MTWVGSDVESDNSLCVVPYVEAKGYSQVVRLLEMIVVDIDEIGTLKKKIEQLKADIDYLVLGCTHYPYLIPQLSKLLPKHVKIIDSGLAVAKQTKAILKKNELLQLQKEISKHVFYL